MLTPTLAKKCADVLENTRKIQEMVSLEEWFYVGKLKQIH